MASSNTQPQAGSKSRIEPALKNVKVAYEDMKNMQPEDRVWVLRWWRRLKGGMMIKDWKRVTHSAKVGLALSLVSLCVLLQDVFDKLGHNAVWAILTVVVVFEYTVGATLSKGLNRGLGTIMAASLGLFVDYMANFTGAKVEPFVVGFSVFVVGMTATYTRFVPKVKARYDYGVVIFLLTFCLVVISGYQVSDNIDVVFDRIVMVMVGVILCLLVSIFIFPVWAGDDLHQLVINNFYGLANSLEECLKEYFQGVQKLSRVSSKICKGQPFNDKIYKGYRGALISKQTEESLANFATWEPRHLRFGCMYPWKRLVEVGAILRHCAYTVSALHGCVLSEIQAPESLKKVFASSCLKIGEEVASVLRRIADDLKARRKTNPKHLLLYKVRLAIEDLNHVVHDYPHFINTCCHRILNENHDHSTPNPNSTSNTNDRFLSKEPTFMINSPLACHDLQLPPLSPNNKCGPSTCEVLGSPLKHRCNSLGSAHFGSHVNSLPKSKSHVNLVAYPLSPNLSGNLKPISNSDPCLDIEVPNLDHISTCHSINILNSKPSSDFQVGKESTSNGLTPSPIANTKGDNKECFMLHESMKFADSLSLASLIALLIEIVARVEHLLDANADFQEQARFMKVATKEETPCADTKVEANHTYNHTINPPLSTSCVE